jgi:peptidoglycan/xylan/chitin deacetylase (PgdA/CDA1 family)
MMIKLFEEDFTIDNYRRLLKLAKAKFTFSLYDNYEQHDNFILWRHDIDLSVEYSLKLAKIEKEEGVVATYFVLPHSEYYSPLERQSLDQLHEIHDMGHEIGIHYDTHFYHVSNEEALEINLEKEKRLFKEVLGFEPKVFSYHNPDAFVLSCDKEYYAGLKNTYAKKIVGNVPYCSDSNGYWRYDRLEDKLKNPEVKNMQVLTHPEWWQEEVKRPSERIKKLIYGRADRNWEFYAAGLQRFGRDNY